MSTRATNGILFADRYMAYGFSLLQKSCEEVGPEAASLGNEEAQGFLASLPAD